MTQITKQDISSLISIISDKIKNLQKTINTQNHRIEDLESKNILLEKQHQNTLIRITEYVKELEQIKTQCVNSNNNTR